MQIQDLVDTQRFSYESTKFILDKSSRICMFHLLNFFYTTRGPVRFSMLLVDTADSRWIPDSIVSGIPDTLSRIPELQILVFFFPIPFHEATCKFKIYI